MKKCAKCEKTVYPTEELKCLDKMWHKGCFRCWECNMTLNMKNYKGYDKLPYCNAHCPKPKHTQVADTPENTRLAENTKIQSQLSYHEQFEQAKGQYTAVADDPETLRNLKNQKIVSQLAYHEQFEQAKGQYIAVADDPETLRNLQNQKNASLLRYHEQFEQSKGQYTAVADDPETLRALQNQKNASLLTYHEQFEQAKGQYTAVADDPETLRNLQNQKVVSQIKYHEDFEKAKGTKTSVVDDPETMRVRKTQTQVSQIAYHDHMGHVGEMEKRRALIEAGDNMAQNMGGRDVHPEFVQPAEPPPVQQPDPNPSPYSGRTQGHTTVYNAGSKGKGPKVKPSPIEPAHNRRVGSIADYDPMNENYGSITQQPYQGRPQQYQQQQRQAQQQQQQQPGYQSYNQRAQPPPQQQPQHQAPPSQPQYHQPVRKEPEYRPEPAPAAPPQKKWGFRRGKQQVPRFRAMYDYKAADVDEVSFMEGDIITNVQQIDEGWMTGTVERSRQSGMLPANYVERVA